MKETKFRQPVFMSGAFHSWHYWGFIDGAFVSPCYTPEKAKKESQQFIGLKDKNGKEIWEGDIIETENGFLWSVYFGENENASGQGWCVTSERTFTTYFLDNSILTGKVIGNIYENPELLEVKP